jgi:hypothetical protein
MQIPSEKQKITKAQGATKQVEAAIEAIVKGNFAVAITLAGAAEGMLEGDGKEMFQVMLKAPGIEKTDQAKWIATLNGERDWLKHVTKEDPRKILEISNLDAGFMIARAASKLDTWTPIIEEFKIWFFESDCRHARATNLARDLFLCFFPFCVARFW